MVASRDDGGLAVNVQAFWVLGDRYTFLHSGESISVLEIESALQHGPPPHVHHNEDETIYVLDGEMKVHKGDQVQTLAKGELIFLPRGIPHWYQVLSPVSRHLVTISPGGFKSLFREIGTPVNDSASDPADRDSTIRRLMELAPRYDLELISR
jgi:quercetin dioxygenase-like cupin family protein